jgi:hypothetical protein
VQHARGLDLRPCRGWRWLARTANDCSLPLPQPERPETRSAPTIGIELDDETRERLQQLG